MKLHTKVYAFIVAVLACSLLFACANDAGDTEASLATTGDATACEYVTPEATLDVERLTQGTKGVSFSGNGFSLDSSVAECDELLSAIAETGLVMKIIPQPTPTPAPGHLLSISLLNEQGDGYFHISLKTDSELWLSVYDYQIIYSGGSDVNGDPTYKDMHNEVERWNFIIESEDGQRIHEIAKGLSEKAD